MIEEEYKECSVVAYPREIKFLHINGGAISYYVDRHISDYVDRLQQKNQELQQENKKLHHYKTLYQSLKRQKEDLKEDISFCLKSIKQEMEMSTDSRTRQEMKSCYEILERWNNE